MLVWLSVWSEVQTCIWPSYSLSLASVKSTLVSPFWYRFTRVVPDKGPLNGCVCVARRLTVGGDVLDGHAGLDGHEAENREDDETAEHARRTVDERHDHSVSEH